MNQLTNIRKFRIGSFAIFDITLSVLSFYLLAIYFKLDKVKMILSILPLSIIFHKLFKINTPLIILFDKNIILQIITHIIIIYIVL